MQTSLGKRGPQQLQLDESTVSQKVTVLYESIDRFSAELNKGFESPEVLSACSTLFDQKHDNYLKGSVACMIVKQYPFCGIDLFKIKSQLDTAKQYMNKLILQPVNTYEVHDSLINLPAVYREILKLLHLILTLPVTTATNERLFSILKRVKTYLRTRYSDERLSDLLVICSSKEDIGLLNLNELVDTFAKKKSRRYPLLY